MKGMNRKWEWNLNKKMIWMWIELKCNDMNMNTIMQWKWMIWSRIEIENDRNVNDMNVNMIMSWTLIELKREWFLYNWNGIGIKDKLRMKMKWQQIKNELQW